MESDVVGIALDSFVDELYRVPDEHAAKPVETFDLADKIGPHARAYVGAVFGEKTSHRSQRSRTSSPTRRMRV